MSEKVQKSEVPEFICEHCGEPIRKNEDFVNGRMVIAQGRGNAIVVYHKSRKECFEASQSEQ